MASDDWEMRPYPLFNPSNPRIRGGDKVSTGAKDA